MTEPRYSPASSALSSGDLPSRRTSVTPPLQLCAAGTIVSTSTPLQLSDLAPSEAKAGICNADVKQRGRAAETCAICAECFRRIPTNATVAIVHSWIVVGSTLIPRRGGSFWKQNHKRLDLPICIECTLTKYSSENAVAESGRCETCERGLRHWDHSSAPQFPRACCLACRHLLTNKRNRERRRVRMSRCNASSGEPFTPQRSDAKTCKDSCRQKLYRETRKAGAAA